MAESRRFIVRFLLLGFAVIFTFGGLWAPFVIYGPSDVPNTTKWERVQQILRRIFPFERGLFEGKVSNLYLIDV